MKILVIGGGGREHALAWRMARDGNAVVVSAPGNPGMAQVGETVKVDVDDVDTLVKCAIDASPDLVVVGPEQPLVCGLADKLRRIGMTVFGPSAAAARIESSKDWANELMHTNGVPCPASRTFDDIAPAADYVGSLPEGSVVIKADGLAAGKGVIIPDSYGDAESALERCLEIREFGDAGSRVVIEERLTGPELSVFGFVDGESVSQLVAARDYKRAYDGDLGPNTGGVGAFTSPILATEADLSEIRETIFQRTVSAMARSGSYFQGMLYAGLMLTDSGPQVIEFNCRFGDPECQVLMLRLDSNLIEVCQAVAESNLAGLGDDVRYRDNHVVAVVTVSDGYPGSYETGFPIYGDLPATDEAHVFHAGTALNDDGVLVSDGGRVLVSTAASDLSVSHARSKAYSLARGASFSGSRFRSDIAADATAAFSND